MPTTPCTQCSGAGYLYEYGSRDSDGWELEHESECPRCHGTGDEPLCAFCGTSEALPTDLYCSDECAEAAIAREMYEDEMDARASEAA